MPELTSVYSVKFEMFLPVTYIDPADATQTPQFVQFAEICNYLDEMTKRYGGYTISNPYAPPPLAGVYKGGAQERSFWVMIIVPDHLLKEAGQDIKQMVSFFQEKYHQKEVLCFYSNVNRLIPGLQTNSSPFS